MLALVLRKRLRAAALGLVTVAGASAVLIGAGAAPALALCKYGTPHCVNRYPGPKLPKIGGAKIPDSGWNDPDCKYYGNCKPGH
jgi:hypothetical protein